MDQLKPKLIKDTPTFHKDGYRRIKCRKCGNYLGNRKTGQYMKTNLGATRPMKVECLSCGYKFQVNPPRRGHKDGIPGIYWGGDNMSSTFTADQNLTEEN